ncbi:MAG: hypothetical protein ACOYU3_11165 [Bacillota bacterium]
MKVQRSFDGTLGFSLISDTLTTVRMGDYNTFVNVPAGVAEWQTHGT